MTIARQALEEAAARTVAHVLEGHFELHDLPGRASAYDYAIHTARGMDALEVTQATDLATENLFGALGKHGSDFEATGLSGHWMIAIDSPPEDFRAADLKQLQRELLETIASVEAEGRTTFNCRSPVEAERRLCISRPFVKFGNRFDMDGEPRVWLNHSPVVSFAAEDLIGVAEAGAALEDNRAKLAKSGLERRHLFVWVNVWELAAAAAFAQGVPPQRAPALPDEITDLWIGRVTDDVIEVWRFDGASWSFHRIPRALEP